jgi:hypothetical protein
MFQIKVVEKIKTHILGSVTLFFSKICEIMWENVAEPGRPQMTMWRMRILCWIHNYKHTLRITHIDFPLTMVTRTRLNVTLRVHCLSTYNRDGVCLLRGTA